MSTDVAIKHIAITTMRNMKEDDAGGGNGGGRNELKLKRKSDELIPAEIGGKKMKKQWKKTIRRKKLQKWKKNSKKPRSLDGDNPSSDAKKVSTTTVAPSSGGNGKRRRHMTESFNAPFNSTQFLMNDHKTEAVRHLDSTLNGGNNAGGQKNEINLDDDDSVDITMEERPLRRITRARESSFSIDSDDDYYYSSPEDEEEFMSREFIKDYDNLRNDRLIDMSKDELINEYLQMEEKIEALEKRLSRQSSKTDNVAETTTTDQNKNENQNEDTNSKEAMASTILQFQKEIKRLESENDQLKSRSIQNAPYPGCSSSCSSSSESDDSESESDSDSDSSGSDSDNGQEEIQISRPKQIMIGEKKLLISKAAVEKGLEVDCEVEGDTGYESGQSNKPVHTVTNNTTFDEGGINPNEEKEVVVNGNLMEKIDENDGSHADLESETESCPELISVNCITSTSP